MKKNISVAFVLIFTFSICSAQEIKQNKIQSKDSVNSKKVSRFTMGLAFDGGISSAKVSFSKNNWQQGTINYNDSLNNIITKKGVGFSFGILGHIKFSKHISFRPLIMLRFEGSKLLYYRKNGASGQQYIDERVLERTEFNLALPLVFNFSEKEISPYFSIGPTLGFSPGQYNNKNETPNLVPVKGFDIIGESELGIHIHFKKEAFTLSPALKYSQGFTNIKGKGNNLYLNTLSGIKQKFFALAIYLRGDYLKNMKH